MNAITNLEKVNLKLRGMSCAACASSIEQAIRTIPGVSECSVNFAAERAVVNYDSSQTSIQEIQDAVVEAGYSANYVQDQDLFVEEDLEQTARKAESRNLQQKIIVGGIVSIILIIGSLPMMTGLKMKLKRMVI